MKRDFFRKLREIVVNNNLHIIILNLKLFGKYVYSKESYVSDIVIYYEDKMFYLLKNRYKWRKENFTINDWKKHLRKYKINRILFNK